MVQWKAPGLPVSAVEIRSPQGDPAQHEQNGFGAMAEIFLVGLRLAALVGQSGIVEQFFQPAGSVVFERRQKFPFQSGKVRDPFGSQSVQTERRLREEGRQKRWNFFLTPAAC